MIITIVNFALPPEIGPDEARTLFETGTAPYREQPGLLRKHYLYRPGTGGGVYFWDSREHAEALFNPAWEAHITAKYGKPPRVEWFDSPVAVINQP